MAGPAWQLDVPLGAIEDRLRAAAVRGLSDAAEHVLAVSNAHVPIEEATLERSGRTSVDESTLTAAVAYDTPYAVRQHEDMTLQHDPGRTAKYLENALNGEAATVRRIIVAELQKPLT